MHTKNQRYIGFGAIKNLVHLESMRPCNGKAHNFSSFGDENLFGWNKRRRCGFENQTIIVKVAGTVDMRGIVFQWNIVEYFFGDYQF